MRTFWIMAAVAWASTGFAGEPSAQMKKAVRQVSELAARLEQPQTESFRIIRYLEHKGDSPMVMLSGGRNEKIVEGALFKSYRRAHSPVGQESDFVWVETGTLKAVQLGDDFSIAIVASEETLESRVFFPKHPGVMAGDWVVEHRVAVARSQVITPTATLAYHEIFEDPKGFPLTFELTPRGKERLVEAAQVFTQARLPVLMVEAYTDQSGPSDANQVESFQRALAVRQFLIEEMGFEPERVIALGYGESDPVGQPNIPGHERLSRRIVLKVRSQEGSQTTAWLE